MKVNVILAVILLGGCTIVQEDKDYIEFKSTIEPIERCRPFYGSMICATEDRVRTWCTLYNEETNE